MTEQNTQTETTASDATPDGSSLDQRIASVYESLGVETNVDQSSASDAAEPEATEQSSEPAAEAEDTDEARAQVLKEREERIAAVRERERRLREERQARRPRDDSAAAIQELESMRAQVEEAARLAKALENEEAFLEEAARRGLSGEKIAEFVRERLLSPETVAERKAAAAAQEAESRIEKKLAELDARIQEIRQAEVAREVEVQRRTAETELLHIVGRAAEHAPFSARYVEHFGPEQYIEYATAVAEALPPGVGLQAVHDIVESNLEALAAIARAPASQAHEPNQNAVAPVRARTVSNSLASERATVRDEPREDWSELSLEERARRLLEA